MKKISIALLFVLMVLGHVGFAGTGKLFTAVFNGNQLTITPTTDKAYPSMGIMLTSNHTVSGCDVRDNGYCTFYASKASPKTLTISGADKKLTGSVCLNGDAVYSCQKITGPISQNPCAGFAIGTYTINAIPSPAFVGSDLIGAGNVEITNGASACERVIEDINFYPDFGPFIRSLNFSFDTTQQTIIFGDQSLSVTCGLDPVSLRTALPGTPSPYDPNSDATISINMVIDEGDCDPGILTPGTIVLNKVP